MFTTPSKSLLFELFEQSTFELQQKLRERFAVNVLQRSSQKILVLCESVSSFTTATIITDETSSTLRENLITNIIPFKSNNLMKVSIDDAPGFIALQNNKVLSSIGLEIETQQTKNKNKNLVIDKAIQQLENEIQ